MGAVVPPFISTMTGTLDGKGRVCIPSAYRQILATQSMPGVYVCPSFYEPALECFGDDVLQAFHQQQASQDPFFTAERDDKTFAILSQTQLLAHDENGRVRLPDEFIAHAGLKEKVTFVGMGSKFQIWASDRFAPIQAERLARACALRDGRRSNGDGA
ncbi:MAG: division/cell wall cluster transcriptional repressor MraZ [Rhizomicrobium sp.]|jgi:MraZ protein